MVYVESKVPSSGVPKAAPERRALLDGLTAHLSPEAAAVIARAFDLSATAHQQQRRASGEPYLTHAVAVADILASLRMDHETIAAAILHDVVEDTGVTLEQVAETCGPEVAHLVDGVTKMKVIQEYQEPSGEKSKEEKKDEKRKEEMRAESLRKLLLAMAEDVRVVLIKLADRLHNMRTLVHLDGERQRRIARETLDIYAPLANRLGIWQVKWELEDLSFRYLEPATYREVAQFLDERRVDRQRYIDTVIATLQEKLNETGITNASVKGRPKHIYSIWKKMKRKGIGFHELFDVRAVRLLVDSVADCYHALGVVHGLWRHIPREFDDYIATPKENMYQSIHTAVVGPEGKTLEVQIRTYDMDRHAELGVAAHWKYKEGGKKADRDFDQKIAWLRQLFEWSGEEGNAGDFIDRFKSEVFQDRVYVLTPRGEVIDLPLGATPLDFAYYIHTDVGHRCRGAKVNGRIVPLSHELKSGEQVEVLTTKHGGPSRDWMNAHTGYIKTSRALSKVRHWFKSQDQQQNMEAGRALLERELHRLGVDSYAPEKLSGLLGFNATDEFLISLGRGDVTQTQIAGAIHKWIEPPSRDIAEIPVSEPTSQRGIGSDITVGGVDDLMVTMAKCCQPAPGDPVIGYITRGRGVAIHRRDCPNIVSADADKRARLIDVEWGGGEQQTYQVDIEVLAIDRSGLLRDITAVLGNEKINVVAVETKSDLQHHTARMLLTLEIVNTDQLARLLNRIGQLPNIIETRRRATH